MIVATVLALLLLPLLVLRGRTLARYFAVDAATWLLAWLLWRRAGLEPGLDGYFCTVALAVVKLTTFSIALAVGRNVRWSANRAALIAAIVFAVAIPAMQRGNAPVDGDEPYYLLLTESLIHDFDLDLANQYAALSTSVVGRDDLGPQFGDPRGEDGELYSRHEPFLALLLVPGTLAGGLNGAIATIALFGVLLVRSTIRWMEDEGIPEPAVRAVFPLFVFGPPVLFYATRIWPEVPAAFFFVETLRGMREQRSRRWLPALLGLVLLKLRFVLVAVALLVPLSARALRGRSGAAGRRLLRPLAIAAAIAAVPMLVIWMVTGDATSVHSLRELVPATPLSYAQGLGGLLADGMSGIAFQAPFYLLALVALMRWRSMPPGFRMGIAGSLLYLFFLLPRGEWHGGWAPPLRYLVFLMPVLALGIAAVWDRISRGAIVLIAAWSAGLVMHGLAYPWRLFHEFNGENAIGEWLSQRYGADFSRLFPSFIRMNDAAWWGVLAAVLLPLMLQRARVARSDRSTTALAAALTAVAIAAGFYVARLPASHVELEDAHVEHRGGKLYPDPYTVMRASYRGGWIFEQPGESASFSARAGTWTLHYITGLGSTFELAGRAYTVPASDRHQTLRVTVPQSGRVTLRNLSGAINVDRLERYEGEAR